MRVHIFCDFSELHPGMAIGGIRQPTVCMYVCMVKCMYSVYACIYLRMCVNVCGYALCVLCIMCVMHYVCYVSCALCVMCVMYHACYVSCVLQDVVMYLFGYSCDAPIHPSMHTRAGTHRVPVTKYEAEYMSVPSTCDASSTQSANESDLAGNPASEQIVSQRTYMHAYIHMTHPARNPQTSSDLAGNTANEHDSGESMTVMRA